MNVAEIVRQLAAETEAAWREGWNAGYRAGHRDGHSDGTIWCDIEADWEKSETRKGLARATEGGQP